MRQQAPTRPWWPALLAWFNANRKSWPWRSERTPYGSWVAEVMSQQTALGAVAPRWRQFMDELPTVAALASCEEETLRRLWAGLGYYARARNLLLGARLISRDRGGAWPSSHAEWLCVPGCGPYTAAVLSSLHCGDRVPCIDGNVVRVMSRYLDLADATWTQPGRQAMAAALQNEIAGATSPGDFNEAIMELGQLVCRKTSPLCDLCPLGQSCAAKLRSTISASPPPRPRRPRIDTRIAILVLRRSRDTALVLRIRGLLKHTTGLPILSLERADRVVRQLENAGARTFAISPPLKHSITHHDITATVWSVKLPATMDDSILSAALGASVIEWCETDTVPGQVAASLDRKALDAIGEL